MLNDLKYAWRQIQKAPGFAITALLTLAIGIGVNAAVFSVMDAIVLRPLAVPDLDRVMTVAEDRGRGGFAYEWVAAANYEDWKQQSKSFESLAAFKRYSMALTGAGEAAHVEASRSTANFWNVLRMDAFMGRVFRADECQPGRDAVAVLSYSFWQKQFGSDGQVLGRKIRLDDREYADCRRDAEGAGVSAVGRFVSASGTDSGAAQRPGRSRIYGGGTIAAGSNGARGGRGTARDRDAAAEDVSGNEPGVVGEGGAAAGQHQR